MSRQKFHGLLTECLRRQYLRGHGNLKGFGEMARYYNEEWCRDAKPRGGYKSLWDNKIMVRMRAEVGM